MKQKMLGIYFGFFGYLAKRYLRKYSPYTIGITGSIGKTSCRMIIYTILQQTFPQLKIYTSQKNFNGELGMSLSILGIGEYSPNISGILKTLFQAVYRSFFGKKLYDIIVLEYGIDHVGEMEFLLSIEKPHIGVVTKIDAVHFEDKNITAREKFLLLQNTKEFAFLNFDDPYSEIYKPTLKCKTYYYTTNNKNEHTNIDIIGKNYTLKKENNHIISEYDYYINHEKKGSIVSSLIGEENIGYINIGLMISNSLHKKFYNRELLDTQKDFCFIFELQYSRFSIFEGKYDSIIIDSSYNAAPESMKKVIENFLIVAKNIFPEYKIILCLGEMRELGEHTKQEHEFLADFTDHITENIFLVGSSMKKYFLEKNKQALHFENSRLLGKYVENFLSENTDNKYLLLFKGSQNTIFMEEGVKYILKNKDDIKLLCRQEDFWQEKKEKFFTKQ